MDLSARFRAQASACAALGSPMYAALLASLADDIDAGGPTSGVLLGHEADPGPSALALRLAGTVHRLVLERRAGALAAFYPSVGGSWDDEQGAAAFLALLTEQPEAVRQGLDRPPQTNEVGRSAALMGGLLHLGEALRLPVRLREVGSSAGLNLRVDEYAFTDQDGLRTGPRDAGLVLEGAWAGRRLDEATVRVQDRVGSDIHPVDPTTTEGRLTLTSYVWPDQVDRLGRLRAALEVAQRVPAEVRRAGAAAFVDSLELVEGTTTVLWHSVMWQYLPRAEQQAVAARIEALGRSSTKDRPFAHLSLEPARRAPESPHEFLVTLRLWPVAEPGGGPRVLGSSVGHGVPTTWE